MVKRKSVSLLFYHTSYEVIEHTARTENGKKYGFLLPCARSIITLSVSLVSFATITLCVVLKGRLMLCVLSAIRFL
jgi:hypothetical protein